MQDPTETTARSRSQAASMAATAAVAQQGGTLPAGTLPADRDDTVIGLIGKQRILSRIPREELRALVRQASVRAVREREKIFAEGDEGHTVMLVLEGHIKLSSMTAGGREVIHEIAGPGDVFGELAVLNDWPRSADAEALQASTLLFIDGAQFRGVLARAPEALFAIVRLLSQRLRATTEHRADVVALKAPTRLAKALLHLAALQSHAVKNGLRIDLQLSQSEIGGMTGLIRESINKILARWQDAGWVETSGRSVTLHDVAALQALIQEDELG